MARIPEDIVGRPLLDELAGVQDADAVAHLGDDREIVADKQQRGVELRPQPHDQVEHLGLDGGVQSGRGLVEDEQRRLGRERHRDDRTLQHPAGELVGIAAHHAAGIGDPDLRQHLLGAAQGLLATQPGDLVDLGDLAADQDRGVERPARLLVDHRHRAGPEPLELRPLEREDVAAIDLDPSGADAAVAGQIADDGERDRRLATAGLADQAERFAPGDVEADIADHPLVLAPDAIGDVDVRQGQRVAFSRPRRPRLLALGRAHQPSSADSMEVESMLTPMTRVAMARASNSTCHQ